MTVDDERQMTFEVTERDVQAGPPPKYSLTTIILAMGLSAMACATAILCAAVTLRVASFEDRIRNEADREVGGLHNQVNDLESEINLLRTSLNEVVHVHSCRVNAFDDLVLRVLQKEPISQATALYQRAVAQCQGD